MCTHPHAHTHTHMHTHSHRHTHTCTCTHTRTHTKKAKPVAAVTQLLPPTEMPGITQALEPCAPNSPGAGIVTRRRAVQVSRIEITDPMFPNRLVRQGQLDICFASLHEVPIGVTTEWAASLVDTTTRSPIQQLGRLEQYK